MNSTEEQQLEEIKEWWRENKRAVMVGVVLGLAGLFGWQAWEKQQRIHSEEASTKYNHILSDAEEEKFEKLVSHVDELVADYDDTPYAELAVLVAAKAAVILDQTDVAKQRLQWAIDNARMDETRYLAQLRLARIQIVEKNYDDAGKWLAQEYPASFLALVEEMKGDIHVGKGEIDAARVAYDKALAVPDLDQQQREIIQMKRDELGNAAESSE